MAYMHQDKSKPLFCPGGDPWLSSIGAHEIDYVLCNACGEPHKNEPNFSWTPVWDTDSAYANRKADYERIVKLPYDTPRDLCAECGKSC